MYSESGNTPGMLLIELLRDAISTENTGFQNLQGTDPTGTCRLYGEEKSGVERGSLHLRTNPDHTLY